MEKLAGLVLLLAALNVALARDKITPKYYKDGGVLTLELSPRPTEPITQVLWMFQGNLVVAEWVKDEYMCYFKTFIGRTTMDLTTGRLDIINMAEADMGVYSVEVNSVGQNERYNAVMIKEVPDKVWVRPLVCPSASDRCTLACEADPAVLVDAGPVTYSWKKKGDGGWTESGKDLDITKEETAGVETFTCRIQNPVSARESRPQRNQLLEPGSSNTGKIVGGSIGAIVVVVAVAVAVGGILYFKKKKRNKKTPLNIRDVRSPADPGVNGPQADTPDKKPETEGLLGVAPNQDGGSEIIDSFINEMTQNNCSIKKIVGDFNS